MNKIQRVFLTFILISLTSFPVIANEPHVNSPMFTDRVVVIDSFPVLSLKSGRRLVLSGIERPSTGPQPQLDYSASKDWLARQILDQTVIIKPSSKSYDFLGRIHGLLKIKGKDWVNFQLLKSGQARAQATVGFTKNFDQMLRAEKDARLHSRGRWADKTFKIYDIHKYDGPSKGYIIAEGKIHKISKRKNYIYINFSEDWRKDFTIGIWRTMNHFDSKTLKFEGWEGQNIQVRGLVEQWNGPFIKLTLPQHLTLLGND